MMSLPTNSSKHFLEELSRYCSSQQTLYEFNKSSLQIDDKYREGRLTALGYIADLSFYFMQREKEIKEQFIQEIAKQIEATNSLKTPAYQQGILDTLHDIKIKIEKLD